MQPKLASVKSETLLLGMAGRAVARIKGITGRMTPLEQADLALTQRLFAEVGEASTMSAVEVSNSAKRLLVEAVPPFKSSRSRKTARSLFGTRPIVVARPTRSWSLRKFRLAVQPLGPAGVTMKRR